LDWQQDVTVTQAKQLTTVAATVGNGWSNSWQRLEQQLATVGATVGNGCSNVLNLQLHYYYTRVTASFPGQPG